MNANIHQKALVDRFRSYADDADGHHKQWAPITQATLREAAYALERLAAENAELRKDAGRYRWLREYNTALHPKVTEAFFIGDATMDKAIDAAMAEVKCDDV